MNLIDRYVAEVGRHLPEKDRADIEAEIRSLIEDMLEERGQSAKSADEKSIAETLEELGDPKLLAYKYSPVKRYLIGPDWFDLYLTTLKRVLFTALPIVAMIAFVVAFSIAPLDFGNAAGDAFSRVINIGIGILFWVTVGFIIAEHAGAKPEELGVSKIKAWTVAHLPKLPAKRQIGASEVLTNIVFLTIFLAWVVLPPFTAWLRGDEGFVQVFHPNLWNVWLPIFFVIAVLTLILELFKLKIGNWTPSLTASNVILCIGSIVYIIALVTTQKVFNPVFLETLTQNASAEELSKITSWAAWSVNLSAAIMVGIYIWDMADSVIKSRRLAQGK
ncbi:MAG: hypothetical protein IT313_08620 [Anaerolineales bacterium]|nr:hypothetical protein [Anaerolineales bacterium]